MKLIILDNAECFNGSKSMRICSTELLQHLLVCDFHRYVTSKSVLHLFTLLNFHPKNKLYWVEEVPMSLSWINLSTVIRGVCWDVGRSPTTTTVMIVRRCQSLRSPVYLRHTLYLNWSGWRIWETLRKSCPTQVFMIPWHLVTYSMTYCQSY